MQFERIRKSHKRKIIIGGLILVCVISAITITTTRAKYKITQDIPLAKGTVNYNPDKTKPVVSNIVSSVTETEITVTVSASDNVGVTEYWYSINNGAFQKGTSNTYKFTGLKASTSYTIKVYVKDGAGNQSDTTTKSVKTTDTTKPVVSNIVASATETEINVTVSASDNVAVTEYWYAIGTGTFQKGTSNTYKFTGLKASTSYTIKVYVKDAAGNQSDTTTKTIKTTDTTKPTISNVTTTVTKTEISVTVSASDNVGVTEYWYQLDSKAVVKGTGNTYKFTGLAAGSTHTVKVYVKDAAGNQSTTTTKSNITTTAPSGSETILGNITVKPGTPDFSKVATTDEGVYKVSDGMYGGYSYYWRGAVTNNYVKFAGKCWRIIRINGDGSIRLIYDGATCHANGTSTAESIAKTVVYNTSYNNSSYVGWTYSLGSQRTTSGTASNAKIQLESWYNSNLASHASKIADGKYCNDRNVGAKYSVWSETWATTWSGTGTRFAYAGIDRLLNKYQPTLSCSSGDVYTLKVGLITADEVEFAGGKDENNTSYYLYNGQNYWTMSPYNWNSNNGCASVFYVRGSDGYLANWYVNSTRDLRPVINLKSNVTFSGGNGTLNNPYVVQ